MSRKRKKPAVRTMVLDIDMVESAQSWRHSHLMVTDIEDYDHRRRVRINIAGPSDIAAIRLHLKRIEDYWKGQLGMTT
jgi:hypothetical protein